MESIQKIVPVNEGVDSHHDLHGIGGTHGELHWPHDVLLGVPVKLVPHCDGLGPVYQYIVAPLNALHVLDELAPGGGIVELVVQCLLAPRDELLHPYVQVDLDKLRLANVAPLLDEHVVLGHVLHEHDV